jgi:hypothetical protein
MSLISTGADWDFELIERYEKSISGCAAEFGLRSRCSGWI